MLDFIRKKLTNYAMSIFSQDNKPLKVTLLLLPESSMMTLASLIDPMRAANRLSDKNYFRWKIMTPDGESAELTCGISIAADGELTEQSQGDALVIIAGFNHHRYVDKRCLKLLNKLAPGFKSIGGVEAGVQVLARAGLLDGKRVTTHWEDFEDFANQYRNLTVCTDRFVIDGSVFTTGGASPTFDFMLHLIRSRFGYPLALEVASVFIYDETHASSDAQPLVSKGQLTNSEPRVTKAIDLMESHIDEPKSIAAIASRLLVSTRTLENLFSKTLGSSPGAYYLRLRLQSARKMVLDTNLPMQEIAVRCGFNDLSSFSRSFKLHYRIAPRFYRFNHR